MADYVFATCLPGLEPALKREVARTRPELRFAHSRPGLVTFQSPQTVPLDDLPGSVFARVWGRSIGAASDPASATAQLANLGTTRVHAFARDPDVRVDLSPWQLGPGGPAADGELVADIIVAPDEPVWIGMHRADPSRPPHPGAAIPIDVPADAPSRAYAQIEEAIAWAHLPVEADHVALEIGGAPGGALYALARRGLDVWGVDPGDIAPNVAALPNVHHLAKKLGALRLEDLPPRIDWLLVDVNLAPQVALHEIARLMPRLAPSLKGAVITLKVNDWSFVDELPTLAARIRKLGFTDLRMRHLPSNRRDLCAVAR